MGDVIELKPATIAKLDLGPDDVVIVRSSENLTSGRASQLAETVKAALGEHKVLVVAPNISIEVIAK